MTSEPENPKQSQNDQNQANNSNFRYYVLAASFLTIMMTLGYVRSSVIYLDLWKESYNISEFQTAAFLFFPLLLSGLTAPFAAILCSKYPIKYVMAGVTVIGSAANIIGPVFCYKSYYAFMSCLSTAGALYGNMLLIVPMEINTWFSPEQRVFATAIAFTGSSIGALWIGPLFTSLLDFGSGNGNLTAGQAYYTPDCQKLQLESQAAHNYFASLNSSGVDSEHVVTSISEVLNGTDNQQNMESSYIWRDSYLYLSITQAAILTFSTILIFMPRPSNTINYCQENKAARPSFSRLIKFRLYKYFLLSQVCYVVWRSGYMNFIVKWSKETPACFSHQQAANLLIFGAIAEILFRPTMGRIAQGKNLYFILGCVFILQSLLTFLQPYMPNYWSFSSVVFLIGALQGCSGGLFMQTVTDSTSTTFARHAYSVNSALGVFVAGFANQFYGKANDIFEEVEVIKLSDNYLFYFSGLAVLMAAVICFRGSMLENVDDDDAIDDREGGNEAENYRQESIVLRPSKPI